MAGHVIQKKQYSFPKDDMETEKALKFLQKCKKKQSQAIVYAINELISCYGLEDATQEDVNRFLENYKYVRAIKEKFASNSIINMNKMQYSPTAPNIQAELERTNTMSTDDMKSRNSMSPEKKKVCEKALSSFHI